MRPWLTESDYDLGAAPADQVFDQRHEVVDGPVGKARPRLAESQGGAVSVSRIE